MPYKFKIKLSIFTIKPHFKSSSVILEHKNWILFKKKSTIGIWTAHSCRNSSTNTHSTSLYMPLSPLSAQMSIYKTKNWVSQRCKVVMQFFFANCILRTIHHVYNIQHEMTAAHVLWLSLTQQPRWSYVQYN